MAQMWQGFITSGGAGGAFVALAFIASKSPRLRRRACRRALSISLWYSMNTYGLDRTWYTSCQRTKNSTGTSLCSFLVPASFCGEKSVLYRTKNEHKAPLGASYSAQELRGELVCRKLSQRTCWGRIACEKRLCPRIAQFTPVARLVRELPMRDDLFRRNAVLDRQSPKQAGERVCL